MIGCVLVLFPTLFLAAASSLTKPISYDFQGEFALRYEAHVSSNKSVRVESLGDWNIFKVRLEFDDCPIQNTSDPSVTFCYRTITENMYEGLRTPKEDLTNATAL
uniref:Secreted protein n=1 Tax=Steinernema glaseri TaxID=37863 RepID=A0A1I8AGD2_9BILA